MSLKPKKTEEKPLSPYGPNKTHASARSRLACPLLMISDLVVYTLVFLLDIDTVLVSDGRRSLHREATSRISALVRSSVRLNYMDMIQIASMITTGYLLHLSAPHLAVICTK